MLSSLDPTRQVRPRGRTLLLSFAAAMLLWNLPLAGFVLPFKLLATWLHEMSHGLVMLVTGTGLDPQEPTFDSIRWQTSEQWRSRGTSTPTPW